MGLTNANAKILVGQILDSGGVPTIVPQPDGTFDVYGEKPGASFTTAQMTTLAATVTPAAIARADRVRFTNA